MTKDSEDQKPFWGRFALTLLIQAIIPTIAVVLGVTYSLGQYDQKNNMLVEKVEAGELERDEIIDKIDRAVLLNARKGEIIARNSNDVSRLETAMTKLELDVGTDVREVKTDLNKQLETMEKNITTQIQTLMYVIENQ